MTTPLTVTRIGHACQLIQIGATRVLTDPWFTQTATYYHGEPVTSTVETLGRIDAVLVSHEHYDHCDLDALVGGGFDLGDAFRAHLATGHIAHFFTELARHSTTDAKALVQLVELHAP